MLPNRGFLDYCIKSHSGDLQDYVGVYAEYENIVEPVKCVLLLSKAIIKVVFFEETLFKTRTVSISKIKLEEVFEINLRNTEKIYYLSIILKNKNIIDFSMYQNSVRVKEHISTAVEQICTIQSLLEANPV